VERLWGWPSSDVGLRQIDLRGNSLTTLPQALADLPKLEKLDLRWISNLQIPVWIPAPKNQSESFVKALSGTARFKTHGSTLERLNEDGAVLARMEVSKRI
jgi:hypothetical protein